MDPIDAKVCANVRLEEITPEGGALRFRLMPTLNHMAAVKIASHLWTTKDLRDETSALFKSAQSKAVSLPSFMSLSSTIEEEVAGLPLPSKLSSHVKFVASRLAIEIFKWIHCQSKLDSSFKPWDHLGCIQWTSWGRINGGMTAQLIMSKDGISEEYKSNAPKYYCFHLTGEPLLKHIIDNFWFAFDFVKNMQNLVNLQDIPHTVPSSERSLNKETYLFVESEERKRIAIEGSNILFLTNICDERAWRQLWTWLNEETKLNILTNFSWCKEPDLLCFFLSQMDEDMQRDYFKSCTASLAVLVTLFSDWLWQDYFIPAFLTIYSANINHFTSYLCYELVTIISDEVYGNSKCNSIFSKLLCSNMNYTFPTESRAIYLFNKTLISLFRNETMEIFKLLYSLVPNAKKAEHLDTLIDLKSIYLKDDIFPIMQFIVNQIFVTPEEIEHYILNDFSYKMKDLVIEWSIETLDSFINLFFVNKPKISTFKRNFLVEYNPDLVIDHILNNSTYEFLNEIISYCFSGDEEDIRHYKKTHIFMSTCPLVLSLIVTSRDICMKELEDFFCFCLGQEEGIPIGRRHLLQDNQKLLETAKYFLNARKQGLIDEFLDWCFASNKADKEAFKRDRLQTSDDYRLYETFWFLYNSQDPEESFRELRTSLEEARRIRNFAGGMDFREELWNLISFLNLEVERLEAELINENMHMENIVDFTLSYAH